MLVKNLYAVDFDLYEWKLANKNSPSHI